MGGGRLEAGRAGPTGICRERGARGGPGRAGGSVADHRAGAFDDRIRQGINAREIDMAMAIMTGDIGVAAR